MSPSICLYPGPSHQPQFRPLQSGMISSQISISTILVADLRILATVVGSVIFHRVPSIIIPCYVVRRSLHPLTRATTASCTLRTRSGLFSTRSESTSLTSSSVQPCRNALFFHWTPSQRIKPKAKLTVNPKASCQSFQLLDKTIQKTPKKLLGVNKIVTRLHMMFLMNR